MGWGTEDGGRGNGRFASSLVAYLFGFTIITCRVTLHAARRSRSQSRILRTWYPDRRSADFYKFVCIRVVRVSTCVVCLPTSMFFLVSLPLPQDRRPLRLEEEEEEKEEDRLTRTFCASRSESFQNTW